MWYYGKKVVRERVVIKGQEIVTCPQCGENKVQKNDMTPILFLVAIIIIWIPVVGWALGSLCIVYGVIGLMKKGVRFTCQECKQSFRVSKEKYDEYKNYLSS